MPEASLRTSLSAAPAFIVGSGCAVGRGLAWVFCLGLGEVVTEGEADVALGAEEGTLLGAD
jgi:hypothetical protein